MPTKTKSKKKQTKTKSRTARRTPLKKTAKKKAVKAKTARGISKPKKQVRKRSRRVESEEFSLSKPRTRSGGRSGDFQGLSTAQGADSESVSELLDEGNPFEASVVAGVEAADEDEGEVRTHEVLEDDVPEEYLDKD